jgi:acetyl esterase/lipase
MMLRFIALAALLLTVAPTAFPQDQAFSRVEDVIYGRKFGTALTLDVFTPTNANGYGTIGVISGGWFSSHDAIKPSIFTPLLQRGYTVFAVVHGSQPKFTITEITPDLHRAVRFVRHNASNYKINPDAIGITGGSAGGHLSLTMGTQGGAGRASSKDPVERENSAVQAVACFFPPTDFLNYSEPGEDAVGVGRLKNFKAAFGDKISTTEERQELGKQISPFYFISSNTAPSLIIHGDADKLVPIYQAEIFVNRCKDLGVPARLVVREGAEHGWKSMTDDIELFADWFDQHLRKTRQTASQ